MAADRYLERSGHHLRMPITVLVRCKTPKVERNCHPPRLT